MSEVEFTPRQKNYIRKKSKPHEPDPSEEAGELNIVPFLDIVTNLIVFILATTASVLTVHQLEAQLPTLSRSSRRSGDSPASSLNLNVTLTAAGVVVAGSSGKVAPGCDTTQGGAVVTVPKRGTAYDFVSLNECMTKLKRRFPDESTVTLGADFDVQYSDVIKAMDALRVHVASPTQENELFPQIMLSAGVR